MVINNKLLKNVTGFILWENPNPTSDFSTQNITLSSSDYDVLELFYRSDSTGGTSFSTKCLKGYGFQCEFNSTSSTNRWVRRIDRDSDTSYNVRNCIKVNDNTTANAQCVPLYVVGYKTGIF